MFQHVYPFLRLAIVLSLFASPVLAADAAPGPLADPGDGAFIAELQTAVAKKDEAWLSAHASYPLLWNKDAKAIHVKTTGQFESRFDKMLTPELQAAVAAQKPGAVFRNWQGMMIGDGGRNIWVRKQGEDYRIVTINDDSRIPEPPKME